MKFIYYDLNVEFKLDNNSMNFFIIENSIELDKFVLSIYNTLENKDESIKFFDEDNIYKNENIELVLSPIDFIYEKRKIQKSLFKSLTQDMENSELFDDLTDVLSNFLEIIDLLKVKSGYDIDFTQDFTLDMVFKSIDLKLKEVEGTFVERFIEYAKNLHGLLNKELFILVGCSQYIDKDEFFYLKEFAEYEHIYLLFIENRQIDLKIDKNEYIIDLNLCEIH